MLSVVSAATAVERLLIQLGSGWIQKAVGCLLVKVASLGDLLSGVKELWRY
ncbi:MAG: hypothetical protein M1548_01315 [Actinobacteria bacterium]|nr:hypothetical protein [Actinomycetota bacterium]